MMCDVGWQQPPLYRSGDRTFWRVLTTPLVHSLSRLLPRELILSHQRFALRVHPIWMIRHFLGLFRTTGVGNWYPMSFMPLHDQER